MRNDKTVPYEGTLYKVWFKWPEKKVSAFTLVELTRDIYVTSDDALDTEYNAIRPADPLFPILEELYYKYYRDTILEELSDEDKECLEE